MKEMMKREKAVFEKLTQGKMHRYVRKAYEECWEIRKEHLAKEVERLMKEDTGHVEG